MYHPGQPTTTHDGLSSEHDGTTIFDVEGPSEPLLSRPTWTSGSEYAHPSRFTTGSSDQSGRIPRESPSHSPFPFSHTRKILEKASQAAMPSTTPSVDFSFVSSPSLISSLPLATPPTNTHNTPFAPSSSPAQGHRTEPDASPEPRSNRTLPPSMRQLPCPISGCKKSNKPQRADHMAHHVRVNHAGFWNQPGRGAKWLEERWRLYQSSNGDLAVFSR